jgi:hypothetical protein
MPKFHPKRIVLKGVQNNVFLRLDNEDKDAALRTINLSVIGRETCNIPDPKSHFFLRDPSIDDETDKYLGDAHHHAAGTLSIRIEYDLTESGEKVNFRFPKRFKRKPKEVILK